MAARVCGKPYTIDRWCSLLPDHAGPHTGDMGAHVLTRESRLAFEFGTEIEQSRAICSCNWRGCWYTVETFTRLSEDRHRSEYRRR